MASLYDELLSQIGKEASSSETIKQGVEDLSTDELVVLANELASLTGDEELIQMAKILPVYSSGSGSPTDAEIEVEQKIQNIEPEDVPVESDQEDPIVPGPGGEGDAVDVVASREDTEDSGEEKIAEPRASEILHTILKEAAAQEEAQEKTAKPSATEVLYSILKEAAAQEAIDELVEKRAAEMVEALYKEAADAEEARNIVDEVAVALTNNPVKAYEYSEQMMDKAKTIAAAKDVSMATAAAAVGSKVLDMASKTEGFQDEGAEEKGAYTAWDHLSKLAEVSSALESSYEKIAEEIGETAEAIIRAVGEQQGLTGPKLYDFVQRSMEEVKTLAAQNDINLARAAQLFIEGGAGSGAGYVEPTVPSPSVAPSPAKAPVNSNQTQDPDKYIPEMVAPADPQVVEENTETKEAEVKEYIKNLLKEAMFKGLQK